MPTRIRTALVASALLAAAGFARTREQPTTVTVHEWGTFTSVAGDDGRAISWLALDGPADLPSFVARNVFSKATAATVRMETPVLYFYAPRDASVDVRVGFRQGVITEHFPRATAGSSPISAVALTRPESASTIAWRNVRIRPGGIPAFRTEREPSHYYAARETDAAPLEVGADRERFLFYRGIGGVALPVAATVGPGDDIAVANLGSDEIPALMLFENRAGRIGVRVHGRLARQGMLSRPELHDDLDGVRATLEQMLVAQGLYPREARAMVETWRDSWFEEGARLFYVVPPRIVDGILPLEIDPAPAHVTRVFVARLELATRATLADVWSAAQTGNRATLQKYGRFVRPFLERLLARTDSPGDRARVEALLESASTVETGGGACR